MILPGDSVLVGVSGGADSLALLFFLYLHREELGISIACAHLNHNIRGEAEEDRQLTRNFCEQYEIPFFSGTADAAAYAAAAGMTVEEAGRELRYRYFSALTRGHGFSKLALAHHLDDQAETVLFRMARGTGIYGASGIAPVTKNRKMTVIRPFLNVHKEEILKWAGYHKIRYCEDQTNYDLSYSRNRIRGTVLPELERAFPGAGANIGRFAENAADTVRLLDYFLEPELKGLIHQEKDLTVIDGEPFQADEGLWAQSGFRAELIRRACRTAGIRRDLSRNHVQKIMKLFGSPGGGYINLPGGFQARSESGRLSIAAAEDINAEEKIGPYEISLPAEWDSEYYREYKITEDHMMLAVSARPFPQDVAQAKKDYRTTLYYDNITDSLNLRNRAPGDYLFLGSNGGRKKLSRFFIDRKVPRSERGKIPVLAKGSEILWIPGMFRIIDRNAADGNSNIQTYYFKLEGYENGR